MLKLKLQYFGHLMRRIDLFEKTLMLGRLKEVERDNRGWDGWMASPLDMSLSKLRELVMDREAWSVQSMGSQRVRHDWATELNWSWSRYLNSWCCLRILFLPCGEILVHCRVSGNPSAPSFFISSVMLTLFNFCIMLCSITIGYVLLRKNVTPSRFPNVFLKSFVKQCHRLLIFPLNSCSPS